MRVVVLVLVLAGLAGCTTTEGPEAPTPRATSGAPSNASSSPPSLPETASPADLPIGPPPRIAYADDTGRRVVVVHPDGQRERLPGQHRVGVTALATFRDGYLVADARTFEGTVGLAYVSGRHRTQLGPCSSWELAVSRDGSRAAWLTQGCPESNLVAPTVVHVASTSGTEEEHREIDRVGIVGVAGFIGDAVVISGLDGGARLVGPGGRISPLPRLRYARAAAEGRGLYPAAFSPDGSLLAASAGRNIAILEASTGHAVVMVDASGLGLSDPVWEDRHHLLATAFRRGSVAMVRIDLRGRITRVGPIARGQAYPFVFETRPGLRPAPS